MKLRRFSINGVGWTTFYGKYSLNWELGVLFMFKPSMFCVGYEVWVHGVMLFIGPLGIGFGTVVEEDSIKGEST